MALKLGALIKAARNTDLLITPKLNDWLIAHGDEALSEEVAKKMWDLLTTPPRVRSASFSSSSAGLCDRRQVLAYLGVPSGDVTDPHLANIFSDGKWRHLRWQAMLLMAGLIDDIEDPLIWRRKRTRGTPDGRGYVPDDHPKTHWRDLEFGFELKGVNPFIYQKIVKGDQDIKEEHMRQVHRCFLLGGYDLYCVIYENKGTNDWFEWVIEPDDEYMEEQRNEIERLNGFVDREELPSLLPQCKIKTGPVFNECPYGGKFSVCHRTKEWPNLKEQL